MGSVGTVTDLYTLLGQTLWDTLQKRLKHSTGGHDFETAEFVAMLPATRLHFSFCWLYDKSTFYIKIPNSFAILFI